MGCTESRRLVGKLLDYFRYTDCHRWAWRSNSISGKEETQLLCKELYKEGLLIKGVRYEGGQRHVYTREYISEELMPEFPGGMTALAQFIRSTIIYPPQARQHHISGKVFAQFVVGADGVVKDININKGLSYGCNEEVIRILKLMPRWLPGIQFRRAVPVRYSLPISFYLEHH